MVHSHTAAIAVIIVVAVVSLALSVLAARAWRTTGNRKLAFVTVAFWTFFAKSVLTAYALHTSAIGHEDLELIGSGFDLAIVLLLIAPFLPIGSRPVGSRQP